MNWSKVAKLILPLGLFSFFLFIYLHVSFSRFWSLSASMNDLGNMTQGVWGILHKGIPVNVKEEVVGTRFIGHFEPILYLMAPFYALYQSPLTLLFIQSLTIVSGGLIIFYIADLFLPFFWAVFLQILYYLFPSCFGVNFLDFHPETMALLFLPLSYYFFIKKRINLAFLLAILTMFCKESLAPLVGFYGLYLILKTDKKIFGLILSAIAFSYFMVIFFVIIPHFSPTGVSIFVKGVNQPPFAWLGSKTGDIIKNLFNVNLIFSQLFYLKNLNYLLELFGSLFFLPLLSPITYVSTPILLINLLSTKDQLKNIIYQYSAGAAPFMFFGLIFVINRFIKKRKKISVRFGDVILAVLLMFSLIGFIDKDMVIANSAGIYSQKHIQSLESAINLIGKDSSVSTQNNLGMWVANREFIYLIPSKAKEADFILFDLRDPFKNYDYISCVNCVYATSIKEYFSVLENTFSNKDYGLIYYQDKILLFKRNAVGDKNMIKTAFVDFQYIKKNTYEKLSLSELEQKIP